MFALAYGKVFASQEEICERLGNAFEQLQRAGIAAEAEERADEDEGDDSATDVDGGQALGSGKAPADKVCRCMNAVVVFVHVPHTRCCSVR